VSGHRDPDGLVRAAMHDLAPWDGRTLVDLGCGTGFRLPRYAETAATVIGVEPDPDLCAAAAARVAALPNVSVLAGSTAHLPMPDESADVVHAHFSYFLGGAAQAALREVMWVLRRDGALVVVDNDYAEGEFADLLRRARGGYPTIDTADTRRWWSAHGGSYRSIMSEWRFASRRDLETMLGREFRDGAADQWLNEHPDRTSLSLGYIVFALTAENLTSPRGTLPG
jgi:SAM-dependent methyltransferase